MDPLPATPPKEATALNAAKLRAERLSKAFVSVFGAKETSRSPEQKLVLEHLRYAAHEGESSYQFNQSRDGISIIAAGLHRDGAKFLLGVIEKQVSLSTQIKEPVKPKTRK